MDANKQSLKWLYSQIGRTSRKWQVAIFWDFRKCLWKWFLFSGNECKLVLYPFGEIVKQLSIIGWVERASKENVHLAEILETTPSPLKILKSHRVVKGPSPYTCAYPFADPEESNTSSVQSSRLNHQDGIFFSAKYVEDYLLNSEFSYDREICCLYHGVVSSILCILQNWCQYPYYTLAFYL